MRFFDRRAFFRIGVPAGLAAAFVPYWLRSGGHRLPKVAAEPTGQVIVGPDGSGLPPELRINPNVVVGRLEAIQPPKLVLLDAEGLHTVSVDDRTVVDRAIGPPVYERKVDKDISRLRVGDAVDATGERLPNGILLARYLTANFALHLAGIAEELGPNYLMARLLKSKHSDEFELQTRTLMLDPNVVVKKLGQNGEPVPAALGEMNPGQFVSFEGLRADDGTLVIVNLFLGNLKPPGVP